MVFSVMSNRRALGVFALVSLLMLQIAVTLFAPKKAFQDIAPFSVSSYILIMDSTGEGVLTVVGRNFSSVSAIILIGAMSVVRHVLCGGIDPTLCGGLYFLSNITRVIMSSSQCSDMVSRK